MDQLLLFLVSIGIAHGLQPATTVTLLPKEDGTPNGVVVTTKGQSQVIVEPFDVVEAQPNGRVVQTTTTAQAVQLAFQDVLAATPLPPEQHTLYFKSGSTELTEASAKALDGILKTLVNRPVGELFISGHTDSVGNLEASDALSLTRANVLRDLIVSKGVATNRIETIGQGERAPAVATADEVDEPRNRRVDVVIR
jgi:OOP family OmpA-OmpF porin